MWQTLAAAVRERGGEPTDPERTLWERTYGPWAAANQVEYFTLDEFLVMMDLDDYAASAGKSKAMSRQSATRHRRKPMPPHKRQAPALLWCIFLGYFGADRFYLGKPAQGIGRLLITLTVVGIYVNWIWVLVSIVRLARRTELDGYGRPLQH